MNLEQAIKRARLDTTSEEIRRRIDEGELQVLFNHEFVVLWSIYRDGQTDERYFWICLTYGNGRDMVRRYLPQVLEVARQCSCEWVASSTRRYGWRRHLHHPWREVGELSFIHPVPSSPVVDPSTLPADELLRGM